MFMVLSLIGLSAAAVTTWASRNIVTVSPRKRELRLRGKAFTTFGANAIRRSPDIESAALTIVDGGIVAVIEHSRARAEITLIPRFLELTADEVRLGFQIKRLRLTPRSWWLRIPASLARAVLGSQGLVRRGLGATETQDGVLVLATPLDAAPWAVRQLGRLGAGAPQRRLSLLVDDGDVVVRQGEKRDV